MQPTYSMLCVCVFVFRGGGGGRRGYQWLVSSSGCHQRDTVSSSSSLTRSQTHTWRREKSLRKAKRRFKNCKVTGFFLSSFGSFVSILLMNRNSLKSSPRQISPSHSEHRTALKSLFIIAKNTAVMEDWRASANVKTQVPG